MKQTKKQSTSNNPHSSGENHVQADLQSVAIAWLNHTSHPGNPRLKDDLAATLNSCLKRHFACWGVPAGCEDELYQETLLLLIETYLAGNERLQQSVQDGALDEMGNAIGQAINGALEAVKQNIRRRELRYVERYICFDPLALEMMSAGVEMHHIDAIKLKEALDAISRAQASGKLKNSNANLLRDILVEGKSCAQIARERGVTRSAVHQAMTNSVAVIRPFLDMDSPSV